MALVAQDHRETRLCANQEDGFKLQLATFRRGEYTLALPQSPEQCLRNEYTIQYCYFLDGQVIRGVPVYDPFRSSFSSCFQDLPLALQVIREVMDYEGWQLKPLQLP